MLRSLSVGFVALVLSGCGPTPPQPKTLVSQKEAHYEIISKRAVGKHRAVYLNLKNVSTGEVHEDVDAGYWRSFHFKVKAGMKFRLDTETWEYDDGVEREIPFNSDRVKLALQESMD